MRRIMFAAVVGLALAVTGPAAAAATPQTAAKPKPRPTVGVNLMQYKTVVDNDGGTFTFTFDTQPKLDSQLFFFNARVSSSSSLSTTEPGPGLGEPIQSWSTPSGFVANASVGDLWTVYPKAGKTSYSWTQSGTGAPTPMAMLGIELTGLASDAFAVDPNYAFKDPFSYASNASIGLGATSLNTTNSGNGRWNPQQVFFAMFVSRAASGTPPVVTGFANTTAQPQEWSRLGDTAATSTAGVNTRLDVAWKVTNDPVVHDCTATYASAPAAIDAFVGSFEVDAVKVEQQQSSGSRV